MGWSEVGDTVCPIARALAVVGDRWTVLILRDALRGVTRFEGFHARLKCSRAIVAKRMGELVDQGVFELRAYQDHPPRYDYILTDRGRALGPVLMMMSQWSETWLPKRESRPLRRRHTACGQLFQPVLVCSECLAPVEAGKVEYPD